MITRRSFLVAVAGAITVRPQPRRDVLQLSIDNAKWQLRQREAALVSIRKIHDAMGRCRTDVNLTLRVTGVGGSETERVVRERIVPVLRRMA